MDGMLTGCLLDLPRPGTYVLTSLGGKEKAKENGPRCCVHHGRKKFHLSNWETHVSWEEGKAA